MKKLNTMGYEKKQPKEFFDLINAHGIKRVIDIRLYNNSQLSGFTKQNNLKYFLKELLDVDYIHIPLMAPSKKIFNDHKNNGLAWKDYERRFKRLINHRKIERLIDQRDIDGACLLCYESEATNCHRRLVAEYLQSHYSDIEIIHL